MLTRPDQRGFGLRALEEWRTSGVSAVYMAGQIIVLNAFMLKGMAASHAETVTTKDFGLLLDA